MVVFTWLELPLAVLSLPLRWSLEGPSSSGIESVRRIFDSYRSRIFWGLTENPASHEKQGRLREKLFPFAESRFLTCLWRPMGNRYVATGSAAEG